MKKTLDAWAILAWMQGETPADGKVQSILDTAASKQLDLSINIVNIGEVYYRLAKKKSEAQAQTFLKDLKKMPIRIVAASNALVLKAAQLKGRYAISYADAFAAATAIKENAPLVTGDPELKALAESKIIVLEWIRE